MRRLGLALAVVLAMPAALAATGAEQARNDGDAAKVGVLSGLDKITARVTELEIPVGRSVRFGTLSIKLDACSKRPPEETPETTAFVEIDELRPGEEEATRLFTGWMFASSPALSALEHPVYDVWVIDCRTASADSSAPAQEKSAR
jgi:hypothetical protein